MNNTRLTKLIKGYKPKDKKIYKVSHTGVEQNME